MAHVDCCSESSSCSSGSGSGDEVFVAFITGTGDSMSVPKNTRRENFKRKRPPRTIFDDDDVSSKSSGSGSGEEVFVAEITGTKKKCPPSTIWITPSPTASARRPRKKSRIMSSSGDDVLSSSPWRQRLRCLPADHNAAPQAMVSTATIEDDDDPAWDYFYFRLALFKATQEHTNVPPDYVCKDTLQLGKWLVQQRASLSTFLRRSEKTKEPLPSHIEQRIQKFQVIGFELDESSCESRGDYNASRGSAFVSGDSSDDPQEEAAADGTTAPPCRDCVDSRSLLQKVAASSRLVALDNCKATQSHIGELVKSRSNESSTIAAATVKHESCRQQKDDACDNRNGQKATAATAATSTTTEGDHSHNTSIKKRQKSSKWDAYYNLRLADGAKHRNLHIPFRYQSFVVDDETLVV